MLRAAAVAVVLLAAAPAFAGGESLHVLEPDCAYSFAWFVKDDDPQANTGKLFRAVGPGISGSTLVSISAANIASYRLRDRIKPGDYRAWMGCAVTASEFHTTDGDSAQVCLDEIDADLALSGLGLCVTLGYQGTYTLSEATTALPEVTVTDTGIGLELEAFTDNGSAGNSDLHGTCFARLWARHCE